MAIDIHPTIRVSRRSLRADFTGILVPLGILAAGAGTLAYSITHRPDQITTAEEVFVPKVETVHAIPYRQNLKIDVDGVVVPHREIQLPAEVSGQIVQRAEHCRAGKFVKAGEVLFEVDPLDYELEVQRLEQEQQQARLRIDETNVEIANTKQLLELAERDFALQENDVRRMTSLSARKAVAQSDLDRALRVQVTANNALQTLSNRQRLLEAQLNSAQTSLDLATTKLQVAKLDLERTQVKSPIDGVVVKENCEVDSFVQKGSTLVTIEDTSSVEVLCNLRSDQIAWLWRANVAQAEKSGPYELPAAHAEVVFQSDGRQYVWSGVVSRYDGLGLDVRTRTVPCRILIPDPTDVTVRSDQPAFSPEAIPGSQEMGARTDDMIGGPGALMRGMFVHVEIQVAPSSESELLSIPIDAVRPGGLIWVVENNRLQVRTAKVAKTLEDHVLVRRDRTNIDLDDRIIVSPLPAAKEGMDVAEVPTS